jgi:hypothetical protein
MIRRWLAPLLMCAALLGCSTGPFRNLPVFQTKAERDLATGVQAYEDGEYPYAARLLQGSLAQGLRSKSDEASAHKYLAFVHCVSGRERQCREEFRRTLEIDPSFELEPAEAGHPIWGPVFRSVKTRR